MRLRRTLAVAALGGTLALGGLSGTAQAATDGQAASTPTASAVSVPNPSSALDDPPYPFEFVGYYYWAEDCRRAGDTGLSNRSWSKYTCIDGSWLPGDDYELWVVWN